MSAPTRRALLAGSGATLAGGTIAAVPTLAATASPDAALLALCAAFHAAHAEMKARQGGTTPAEDRAADEAHRLCWRAFDSVTAAPPAATDAGRLAKAGVALLMAEDAQRDDLGADLAFVRDVLAEVAAAGGAVPAVLASPPGPADLPDAELLAVAAEALRLEREYCRLCWATDDLDPRFSTPAQPAAAAAFAALQAPYEEAFHRLGDLPATTPAGIRVKAEAVAAYYKGMPPDRDGVAGAALWGLVLDLTGRGAEA